MNFMFHNTLDAVGNILRVHYKSMKCDVSLSQGSISTLFRAVQNIKKSNEFFQSYDHNYTAAFL